MSVQQSLTGEKVQDEEIELPDTWLQCPECGELMLRSWRFDHEHEVTPARDLGRPESEQQDEDDEDDEPEELGSWYDITLEYNVTYRFRVPAYSEHEAKDIAKDWQLDARPADSYHVHTETREKRTITSKDVPDDYDPYGSELLHEAIDRQKEAAENTDEPEGSEQ